MDYQKKYAITQQPGEFLLMQWERGYKKVELSYKDRLIHTFTGAAVKKGLRLNDDQLGVLQLKFSEKPMGIDLIIDGYHSPVNRSHPIKELKKNAVFFWMLMAFALIASFLTGIYLGGFSVGIDLDPDPTFLHQIDTIINLTVVTLYGVAAFNVGKGRPWAFIMGFSVYALFFLVSLLAMVQQANAAMGIVLLFRIGFLAILIINFKHVIAVRKHARYGSSTNEELLDS